MASDILIEPPPPVNATGLGAQVPPTLPSQSPAVTSELAWPSLGLLSTGVA